LPLKATLPITITQKGAAVSVTPLIAGVCSGCHDDAATKAHAALATTADKTETCEVCHGANRDFAVDKVHKP